MRINSKFVIKNLDGTDVPNGSKPLTLGDIVSRQLTLEPTQLWSSVKCLAVAEKFLTDEADLDNADADVLCEIIEGSQVVIPAPLIKARIINEIKRAKEDAQSA